MANIPFYFQGQDRVIYDTQLNQSLQAGVSDNGYVMPSQSTSSITTLSGQMPNGTIWYDSDTNQLKARINGAVLVIQAM